MSEADKGALTQLISPQDNRMYSIPRGQEDAYKAAGYIAPQYDIDRDEIKAQFNQWYSPASSFLVSTIAGVPFAKSAIAGVSTKEQAEAWRQSFDAAQREHPYLDFVGRTAGMVGGAVGLASGIGAVGGALGLGAGAAGAGAAAAEGAVAAGEGLAAEGALGLGAEAATGAGAEAAGGVAQAVSKAAALAKTPIGSAMVEGAASNAALGHIARIDDSALAHAADPEGKEKIQWMLNEHDLIDAAFGAALPGAFGAFGKGLGYIGRKLDTKGLSLLRDSITKAGAQEAVARQGRSADLNSAIDEVLAQKDRPNMLKYVKARVKNAGKDMQDAIEATQKTALTADETTQLKQALRKTLGRNNRLYPRAANELARDTMNVEDLKELNQKIYAEIEFDEPQLRVKQDAQYMQAAGHVSKAMEHIFVKVDPTNAQGLAQRWGAANAEYSKWSLAKQAIKTNSRPASMKKVLSDMASNAMIAGGASAMFGGFGTGPLAVGATGAAFAALKDVNAYHYGQAAKFFGKSFANVGDRLTDAVEAGLYGTPAYLHRLTNRDDYDATASKLSAARADPQTAFVNTRTAMHEAGFPEDIGDDAALAQHSQIQFLASKLPNRLTAPDVATRGKGDPVQQRRLMGQVRTMKDPTYGILYPTKTNMEVLQKFYPNLLFNTQQAVLSQLQKNANLPAASKLWASRVLGRPINNLSSPTFFAMMDAARQQSAAAEQAQQAPRKRQAASAGPSDATRLDQLQGEAD